MVVIHDGESTISDIIFGEHHITLIMKNDPWYLEPKQGENILQWLIQNGITSLFLKEV